MKVILTYLLMVLFVASANAQREYVEVPRDVVLQTIAYQPGSPIRFEDVRTLSLTTGGQGNSYKLRNIGGKAIRKIVVGSSTGAENTYVSERGFAPGRLIKDPPCPTCPTSKTVALTDELRTKLGLIPPMHAVVVLFVVEVEYTDGTFFSDRKVYQNTMDYFEEFSRTLLKARSNRE